MNPRVQRPLILFIAGGLGLFAVLFVVFPPIHITRTERQGERAMPSAFNPKSVATTFWNEKLIPASAHAVEAQVLLNAIAQDATGARNRYGKSSGIGDTTFYMVRGHGTVVAIEDAAVVVLLDGGGPKIQLSMELVFGNTVRDSTGLIDGNLFPNSQDFNDLATELNGIVESRVIPTLRVLAIVGSPLAFHGCFERADDATSSEISVIPLRVDGR